MIGKKPADRFHRRGQCYIGIEPADLNVYEALSVVNRHSLNAESSTLAAGCLI